MKREIERLTGTFRLPSDFTLRGARCQKQSNRVMADTQLDLRGA